jgi:hypothetical protein
MTTDRLNLAKRPFVNKRPVTRTAILLWALGFLLLLVNVFSFWSYLASSAEKRADLRAGQEKLTAARATLAKRESEVAGLDLGRQNDEVAYLNRKIAQRTFSWSRLLDRISAVMPNDVRLQRLSPRGLADERESRSTRRAASRRQSLDRIALTIDGQARSEEAILQLIDNLNAASSSFEDPNWTRESHDAASGLIRFNLTVAYLPDASVEGYVRPPSRFKLSPLPGAPGALGPPALPAPAPQLQAAKPPAAAPAFRTTTRPLPQSPPPPTPGSVGLPIFPPPSRPAARPARPENPLRGLGNPSRPRGPRGEGAPSEQRPNEQGRR